MPKEATSSTTLTGTEKQKISQMRALIRESNKKFSERLEPLKTANGEPKTWRSKDFLVQEFQTGQGCVRLEITVSAIDEHGRWKTSVALEDMQRIKRECGYGDRYGYEPFPPDELFNWVEKKRTLFIASDAMQFPSPNESNDAVENKPATDYEPTVLRDNHVENPGDNGSDRYN